MVSGLELIGRVIGKALGLIFKVLNLNPINLFIELTKSLSGWGEMWDALGQKEVYDLIGQNIFRFPSTPLTSYQDAAKLIKTHTGIDIGGFFGGTEKSKVPKGPLPLILGLILLGMFLSATLGPILSGGLGKSLEQQGNKMSKSEIWTPDMLASAYLRGIIEDPLMLDHLTRAGWTDEMVMKFKQLMFVTPPIQDVIRFTVREVYDPARRAELLSVPTPSEAYTWGHKVGLTDINVDDYWAAHWILPSIGELNTMLHRREIKPEKWKRYMTLADYEPTMIPTYQKIIYNPFTRVDVRRMWDMRTVDESELKDTYLDIGYNSDKADALVVWTKVYTAFPDLVARYKNAWINESNVLDELVSYGMKPDRAKELVETKIKKTSQERVAKERELTKAEILKGIKRGKITESQGNTMLTSMGYDSEEADFIISVELATVPATPIERTLTRTDVIAAMNKFKISVAEARKMLLDMYWEGWEADFLISTYYVPPKEEEAAKVKEKDLTKAEIIKGMKIGKLSPEQAALALMDLGYEDWEAIYLVEINMKPPEGSPQTLSEYENLVQKWRQSAGLSSNPVPEDVLTLEREIMKIKLDIEHLKRVKATDDDIAKLALRLSDFELRYKLRFKEYMQSRTTQQSSASPTSQGLLSKRT